MEEITKELEALAKSAGHFSEPNKENQIVYSVWYSIVNVDENGNESIKEENAKFFFDCKRALDNRKKAMTFIYKILRDSNCYGRLIEGHKHLLSDSDQNGLKNHTYLSLELIIYNNRNKKIIIIPSIEFESKYNDSEIQDFACELKWYQDFNYETDDYVFNVEDKTGTEYDVLETWTLDDEVNDELISKYFDPSECQHVYHVQILSTKFFNLDADINRIFSYTLFSMDPIYIRFMALNFAHQLEKDLCNNVNGTIIQVYFDIDSDDLGESYLIYDSRKDSDKGLSNEIISNRAFEKKILRSFGLGTDGIEYLINSEGDIFECVKETYTTRIISDDFVENLYNKMKWGALNTEEVFNTTHGFFLLGYGLVGMPRVYHN